MITGAISNLNDSNRRASAKYINRRQSATNGTPGEHVEEEIRPSFAFTHYLDRQQIDLNLNHSMYEEARDSSQIDKTQSEDKKSDDSSSWWETFQLYSPFLTKVMVFLLYYIVGIPIYQHYEGWSFTNAAFFLTQTYATVGYGYPTPQSISAKFFTVFYIFIGILFIFSLFTDGARLIIHKLRSKYKKPKKLNKFQVITRHCLNLLFWLTLIIVIPLVAAVFFHYNEGWTMNESIYFAFITSTSLGYVDRTLSKNSTIWFDIFYIIFSITVTIIGFNKLSTFRSRLERAELWQIMEEIELSYPLLEAIDKKTRSVSRAEYVLHMLELEGKVSYESDLKRWYVRFKEFDLDKDGRLTAADVEAYQGGLRRNNSMRQDSTSKQQPNEIPPLRNQVQEVGNVIYRVFDEARDVVMETFFMDRPNMRETEVKREDIEFVAIDSPIQKAAALRNAAKTSSSSFHEVV